MEEAKRVTEPHEKVSHKGQQWFLLLLLPLLVWGIVFACYPLVAEEIRPLIIFNLVEGLKPLGLPLYAALAVAFLITVLYPRTSQGKSFFSHLRHEEGSELLRQGAIACWVLGYGNLLFGVIPSVIGTIAPFLVGMVLYVVRAVRLGERPLWQPRGYILAIGIFLLYDLCTLLWSPNRFTSLEWWIREASLLPSIFLLLMYPPHPRDIRVFMHYALRISYLYLLSIVAIYVVVCWATDTSLGAAFGLEKMYFVFNGTPVGTLFLGSLFGFQHYTYLGFIMLAPILYWLLDRERQPEVRNLLVGSLVGFLLFVFIFQSRILMLVLCGAFSLGLLYFFTTLIFPQKGAQKKRILLLLPIIAVASLLLFLCYPSALKYLIDEHRLNLFETAIMYLKENPLWGYGLGSAEALISPFYQGEYATHFHNQYLLCYVEGGIMSLLFWVVIFISYLRYALRSRNYAALIYVMIMLVVMLIEVITCLSQYLIAMSLMAAFLISTHPYLQKKMTVANEIFEQLRARGGEEKARHLSRFFKCKPGEYGEGDRFLGVTVPEVRSVSKAYKEKVNWQDLEELLASPWHECRLAALLTLVEQYKREPEAVYNFYLEHTSGINNWDLVDLSAYRIVGAHLLRRDRSPLYQLAHSSNMWEQRIAVVSTWAFIREGDCNDTLCLAEELLHHPHDLMHKAVGWMLREVGKKRLGLLRDFLNRYAHVMPRTTLRYSIEKLPTEERLHYLGKKTKPRS